MRDVRDPENGGGARKQRRGKRRHGGSRSGTTLSGETRSRRRSGESSSTQRNKTRRSTPSTRRRPSDPPTSKKSPTKGGAEKRVGATTSRKKTDQNRTSKKQAGKKQTRSTRRQHATTPSATTATPKQNAPAKRHREVAPTPTPKGRTTKGRRESKFRFNVGQSRKRLWVMIVAICGLLVIVLAQVVRLQSEDGESLRAEGESQYLRHRVLTAKRGTIFDRDGQEMAISIPSATIGIDPQLIAEEGEGEEVLDLLSEVVGIDEDQRNELSAEIDRADRRFIYVARHAPLEVGEQLYKVISSRDLRGVTVTWEDKRILPGGDTGKSVVGLTDVDGVGVSGLELKYGGGEKAEERGFDDVLSGIAGSATRAITPDGSTVVGSERVTAEPVPGRDLMLTIDRSVQYNVEQLLLKRVSDLETKGGQVIVLNTKTGETIAMASVVRDPETGETTVTARNSAAVDAYEPGSVVKAITVAAALNERSITPETSFVVPWRQKYADDWLSDAAPHPDKDMTVRDILVHSSNIGTIMIKEGMAEVPEVARRVHWDYMRKFGLGEKTGIDFPGESNGIVKDWDDLWGSERATVSYGQGVSSTSIQLISAINTIANDGVYVVPSVVKGVIDEEGKLAPAEPAATHEVIRPGVATQMHEIMRAVVCEGTAELAQAGIDNYAIAGKTGTGYKAQPNGSYIDADGNYTYYASFVGFFPVADPQVTMLVSIDEPPADSLDRFGGTAAAPLFGDLVPVVANALRVAPEPGSGTCPTEEELAARAEAEAAGTAEPASSADANAQEGTVSAAPVTAGTTAVSPGNNGATAPAEQVAAPASVVTGALEESDGDDVHNDGAP